MLINNMILNEEINDNMILNEEVKENIVNSVLY